MFLSKTMTALAVVIAAATTATAQTVSLSFGTDVVDLPAITGFGTVVSEMEGASMTINCANGISYHTELNAVGVGIWVDDTNQEVGKIMYDDLGTTFRNRLQFDIFFQNTMCDAPVLTMDLRGACNADSQVVWDIIASPSGTPNSAQVRVSFLPSIPIPIVFYLTYFFHKLGPGCPRDIRWRMRNGSCFC